MKIENLPTISPLEGDKTIKNQLIVKSGQVLKTYDNPSTDKKDCLNFQPIVLNLESSDHYLTPNYSEKFDAEQSVFEGEGKVKQASFNSLSKLHRKQPTEISISDITRITQTKDHGDDISIINDNSIQLMLKTAIPIETKTTNEHSHTFQKSIVSNTLEDVKVHKALHAHSQISTISENSVNSMQTKESLSYTGPKRRISSSYPRNRKLTRNKRKVPVSQVNKLDFFNSFSICVIDL